MEIPFEFSALGSQQAGMKVFLELTNMHICWILIILILITPPDYPSSKTWGERKRKIHDVLFHSIMTNISSKGNRRMYMYEVSNLNQGVTSLGNMHKTLAQPGNDLHMYFVSK